MRYFVAFLCSASLVLSQQVGVTSMPEFEVASVKAGTTREIGGRYTYPGGRVLLRGCTLYYLIQTAYGIQPFQVAGGPAWMHEDRFDIEAKPPASSSASRSKPPYPKAPLNEEQLLMLQSLLADRFQLKIHRESREGQVYLLLRGGNALKLADATDKNAYPWAGGIEGGGISGDGLRGINENMDDLAKRLSPYLGRPVTNKTGLDGSYDFRTVYSQDEPNPDPVNAILASVKDLGLKLETAKGPIETLVVEHAEKPTAN